MAGGLMGWLVGHLTWPGVTEPGSGALRREGLSGLGGRKGCRGLADGCADSTAATGSLSTAASATSICGHTTLKEPNLL